MDKNDYNANNPYQICNRLIEVLSSDLEIEIEKSKEEFFFLNDF